MNTGFLGPAVATVPTVYGIETASRIPPHNEKGWQVATVPTVYGIETTTIKSEFYDSSILSLQQYLPFTVLKHCVPISNWYINERVATVPTVYGIETIL